MCLLDSPPYCYHGYRYRWHSLTHYAYRPDSLVGESSRQRTLHRLHNYFEYYAL